MTISLGVDTGGTYSDAVLLQDGKTILGTAKSLTTHADLSAGIGDAIAQAITQAQISPAQISMVSLSTTLATNALVEGRGGRAALVLIGFDAKTAEDPHLQDALQGGPFLALEGGHDHAGIEAAPLDIERLRAFAAQLQGVQAVAIASMFATRNPAHETLAARLISSDFGLPVTCSHHLSAKLNGPKRALTALLNARLVSLIGPLLAATQKKLTHIGIAAPIMVVRGDGALISADAARERPIETILSGPAASLVGAQWLTGADNALVSDIGGTTTDIGVLTDGRPQLDPDGADVGGFRTMVEAVSMRTHGLGGDSQITLKTDGLTGGLRLGPKRMVPLSLLAWDHPDAVLPALQAQLANPVPSPHDGLFVHAIRNAATEDLDDRCKDLLQTIGDTVRPLSAVLRNRRDLSLLESLRRRNIVQFSGLTPSDAAHALGLITLWNVPAAQLGLKLMGRQRTGAGRAFAPDPLDLAHRILDQMTEDTALALLETAFVIDSDGFQDPPATLARHDLMRRALQGHTGALRLQAELALPIIGLGASAATYYPAVSAHLGAQLIVPEHAGVANAIGAVVGQIRSAATGSITTTSEGLFRAHSDEDPKDFGNLQDALWWLTGVLRSLATNTAKSSGAEEVILSDTQDIQQAEVEGRDLFIEAKITVEAVGRPRFAMG